MIFRIGDVDRAIRAHRDSLGGVELRDTAGAVLEAGLPAAGQRRHRAVERDAADRVIARVGHIQHATRRIEREIARVLELRRRSLAILRTVLARPSQHRHHARRSDELDLIVLFVRYGDIAVREHDCRTVRMFEDCVLRLLPTGECRDDVTRMRGQVERKLADQRRAEGHADVAGHRGRRNGHFDESIVALQDVRGE